MRIGSRAAIMLASKGCRDLEPNFLGYFYATNEKTRMKKKTSRTTDTSAALTSPDDKPVIAFETPTAFEKWLSKHHTAHAGLWIRFFKKDSDTTSITYAEALDVALCFGWIDGPVRRGDEVSWLHKFTPRGKRSVWSAKNKTHIERLVSDGRMQPAGQAAVDAAKADGRWDAAYASSSTFVESAEFMAALEEIKESRQLLCNAQ